MRVGKRASEFGFTWRGVPGAIILAAILTPTLMGIDLRNVLLDCIHRWLGDPAMYTFVTRPLVWYALWYWQPGVSPFSLCYLLLILHFLPRGLSRWRWTLVLAWALVNPVLPWLRYPMFGSQIWQGQVVCRVVELAGLWWFTRSWGVTTWVGLASLWYAIVLMIANRVVSAAPLPWMDQAVAWCWHLSLALALALWVWRARRRESRRVAGLCPECAHRQSPGRDVVCGGCGKGLRWTCRDCGYELLGIGASTCPECGKDISPGGETPPVVTIRT